MKAILFLLALLCAGSCWGQTRDTTRPVGCNTEHGYIDANGITHWIWTTLLGCPDETIRMNASDVGKSIIETGPPAFQWGRGSARSMQSDTLSGWGVFPVHGDTLFIDNKDNFHPMVHVIVTDRAVAWIDKDGQTWHVDTAPVFTIPADDTVSWTPSLRWFRDDSGEWHQVKDIESVHRNAGKIIAVDSAHIDPPGWRKRREQQ